MTLKPWAIGPFELLQHAEGHRLEKGDFDRRMALISFDNAIESSITTYLSLDPVQRAGNQYRREDVARWTANFHSKIAFLEEHASVLQHPMKQDRASIIFFHRLRNELYHDGNGVVPAERHLLGIREAAIWTYSLLFDCDAEALLLSDEVTQSLRDSDAKFSEATIFLQTFLSAREALTDLAPAQTAATASVQPAESLKQIAIEECDASLLEFVDELHSAERIVEDLTDGSITGSESENLHNLTGKLEILTEKLEERLRVHQRDIVISALQATIRAVNGNRIAGVISQTAGSGRITCIAAYISACREYIGSLFHQHIIIFDRSLVAAQFVETYNLWLDSASPPARTAQGSNLKTALENIDSGPLVVTVQQLLSQNSSYESRLLVAYAGETSPPAPLMSYFPSGTFIRFSNGIEVKDANAAGWGDIIHTYDFEQASIDGLLLPVELETRQHDAYCNRARNALSPLTLASIEEEQAQAIVDDLLNKYYKKAIVLVADIRSSRAMAQRLSTIFSRSRTKSEDKCSVVNIDSSMDSYTRHRVLREFQSNAEAPIILVSTQHSIPGLDIPAADTCYVTCRLPSGSQQRIASLVARLWQGKRSGRIVDYANNIWKL